MHFDVSVAVDVVVVAVIAVVIVFATIGPLFFIFICLAVTEICHRQDSTPGSLVSEATAVILTALQQLLLNSCHSYCSFCFYYCLPNYIELIEGTNAHYDR